MKIPRLRWPRVSMFDVVYYSALPATATFMMLNAILIGVRADSSREVANLFGMFCTGAGFTSVIFSLMMRRALRQTNIECEKLTHDIVKTTLVKMQRLGLVHPGFKCDDLPGDVDEEMVNVAVDAIRMAPDKRGMH